MDRTRSKMSIGVSCLIASLVVTVVVGTDHQASDIPQYDDDRQGKGLRFGWNSMDGAKRSCVGINGRPGVCMGQIQCANMNGKSVGKCFPFDSCCSITPNSCGGFSSHSTAYFQNPDKFQNMCSYKINIRRNVCQLRIDFEKFSLAQPTKQNNESAYYCERDEFSLLTKDNTRINVPSLCGENSGQHVYVPVDQHTSSDFKYRDHVTLRFESTPRDALFNEPEPLWKLKITQLECPHKPSSWLKIKDIARNVWDLEEELRDLGEKTKYSLAPDGCLQYFTDQQGTFESFNFNRGMGRYTANLNYAVCFKRQPDLCRISHQAVRFQLAYRQNLTDFTDRDCDTAAASQTTTTQPSTTDAPPASTSAPPATTSAPPATTSAPPATTSAPPATTGASPATTGAPPQTTTDAPATTTGAPPATTTGAPPATTTDAPPATTTGAPPATTIEPATTTVRRRSGGESLSHAIFFAETGLMRVNTAAETREARRSNFGDLRGDYLVVPDGVYAGGQSAASKYCGNSIEDKANYVSTIARGPFFVAFITDDYSDPSEDVEKGFRINYAINNIGC